MTPCVKRPLRCVSCGSAVLLGLALLGCEGRSGQQPGEGAPFEEEMGVGAESQTWLLVVDSTSSAPADELRHRFAEEHTAHWANAARYCATDAGAWNPIHRRAVIVYASSDGDQRFAGPDETPALRLDRPVLRPADLTAWGEAVSAALTAPPRPSLAKPTPLAALADSSALVAGLRPADPGRETDLVAAVAGTNTIIASVISATEDASSRAAESYAIAAGGATLGGFDGYWINPAVAPAAAGVDCGTTCAATPRFQAWAAASQGVSLKTWSPGDTQPLEDALSASQCIPRCIAPPPRDARNCRLFAVPRTPGVCPTELGWFPPDPPLPGDDAACEVRALEGDALESCRTDLACTDCEPGYCFSDVPELSDACTANGKVMFPRVIAGNGPNEPMRFRLVCR